MANPEDRQRAQSLIIDGLRHLRAGKVKVAIASWEEAAEADGDDTVARSYIDYIKANRIRVAVHLGRDRPPDDQPLDIPASWPAPPAGLFDAVPAAGAADEEPAAAAPAQAPPVEELPYAEVELTGASRPRLSDVALKAQQLETQRVERRPDVNAPAATEGQAPAEEAAPAAPSSDAAPAPPAEPPNDSDYLALEIVVDDEDDEPPAEADTLPPPPEALDAPELRLEAPPEEEAAVEVPQDYVVDRETSEAMEPLTLERLAGKTDSGSTPAPPAGPPPTPTDALAADEPSLPGYTPEATDDEPTRARERTPTGGGPPTQGKPPPAPTPAPPAVDPAARPSQQVTFDDAATNPRAAAALMARHPALGRGAPSPYSTLAGLGPRVLFADFKDSDLQGAAPPLDFQPESPAGEGPPGAEAPPEAPAEPPRPPERQPHDDYVREQGSFSDDAPTRAISADSPARGIRLEPSTDFVREGSFSDDIPTTARPSISKTPTAIGGFGDAGDFRREGSFSDDIPTTARPAGSHTPTALGIGDPEDFGRESSFSDDLPTRARSSSVEAGPGSLEDLSDFIQEGSFSDDIPTRARMGPGDDRPLIRPMPLSEEFRREPSFPDDLVTLERKGASRPSRKEERLSEELEALLHPDRGLALARQLCESGEFERSLLLTEQLQGRYPDLHGLDELLEANRSVMETKLLDQLGELSSVAIPKRDVDKLADLDLDPREAFLFSRIDGTMSVEDLIDISGMSRFETARILVRLREIGLLDLKPGR